MLGLGVGFKRFEGVAVEGGTQWQFGLAGMQVCHRFLQRGTSAWHACGHALGCEAGLGFSLCPLGQAQDAGLVGEERALEVRIDVFSFSVHGQTGRQVGVFECINRTSFFEAL